MQAVAAYARLRTSVSHVLGSGMAVKQATSSNGIFWLRRLLVVICQAQCRTQVRIFSCIDQ